MSNFIAKRATRPLVDVPRIPGDKSISHRAILLAALANGTSTVHGLSDGDDVMRTLIAVEALGATVEHGEESIAISGIANRLLKRESFIGCGNSGTAMRLLMGMCAGFPGRIELDGDSSLRKRPMDRVAIPLELMGATIVGSGDQKFAPITVFGGELHGIDYEVPVPSAQVKSAIMFAALFAHNPTTVRELSKTRAHTEEMFSAAGVNVVVDGPNIRVEPSTPEPRDWNIALDPSQVAFWVVAALLVKDSSLTFNNVYVGKERIGFVDVLKRMNAKVEITETDPRLHVGEIHASYSKLSGTDISPEEVPSLIDEIPILAVAAAHAHGQSVFRGLGELRIKESDRLATTSKLVSQLGARASVDEDELRIEGGAAFTGGFVATTEGDHRLAMSAAVAALAADSPIEISEFSSVETSYPKFAEELSSWT